MQQPSAPLTLVEKIWRDHTVTENSSGETMLYIDRLYLTDTSFLCFDLMNASGGSVRRPELIRIVDDHIIPTLNRETGPTVPDGKDVLRMLQAHLDGSGIQYFSVGDPRQGIVHVTFPELGFTLPGMILCCDDSHTTTNGAFGAIGLGVGYTDAAHIAGTQTYWQRRYRTMRINLTGQIQSDISAKDITLALIGRLGAAAGIGYIIEYSGECISTMSMEARMTLCNMAVEAGARAGLIAPDQVTLDYLKHKAFAPKGAIWDKAVAYWSTLKSDPGAVFDQEFTVDVSSLAPAVTWGTSPEDTVGVNDVVPDPQQEPNKDKRRRMESALDYMGLRPGQRLIDIEIDRVFIGSCTNGRIEDLRAAAAVAAKGRARVPAMIVPGSSAVRRQAEAEGLDEIFIAAGFEWHESGCSLCGGFNGEQVKPGLRCATTTNRNFVGRQGPGSRTHLMSPQMAAAAAIAGRIVDYRTLLGGA